LAQAACENEAVRSTQGSTYLPECRAWELVSPGSAPSLEPFGMRAAASGGIYAYSSKYPMTNAGGSGFYYLARRGETGWAIEEVAPQDSSETSNRVTCYQALYYSASLNQSVLSDGWEIHEEEPTLPRCGNESEVQLAPGAPVGFGNLFLRSEAGSDALINATPEGVAPANAVLQWASSDLSHVVFREKAGLAPGAAPTEYNLYEWSHGELQLVSVMPNGQPAGGAELADGIEPHSGETGGGPHTSASLATAFHAVSGDGERVFFTVGEALYVRVHALQPPSAISAEKCVEPAKACTVQVDLTQGGSGPNGGGTFWYANASGSRVFFADENRLTTNSFAIKGRPDLYEYDIDTGVLTDLTPGRKVEPGDARGLSGASEDGSYVYFVADSILTGSQQNVSLAVAQPEQPNLYLAHEGALTFIATLSQGRDQQVWQELSKQANTNVLRARVSPNGLLLEFQSANALTPAVDNAPAEAEDCGLGTESCSEVYLYEAGSQQINCVSCGSRAPTGNTEVPPTGHASNDGRSPGYLTRTLFESGQVFFTTPNALATQDENHADDVYEYREGSVWLLSGGQDPAGAELSEATEDGREVFFITGQALVHADTDSGYHVYDARVGGGFLEEPPSAPEPCEGETCLAPPSGGLAFTPPGSVGFVGPGNENAANSGSGKPGSTGSGRGANRKRAERKALRRCARKHRRRRVRQTCERKVRSRFDSRRKTHGYTKEQSHRTKGAMR
jgi:hypothetical protein